MKHFLKEKTPFTLPIDFSAFSIVPRQWLLIKTPCHVFLQAFGQIQDLSVSEITSVCVR